MTELPDTYLLSAEEEAKRLWQGAKTAQESASEDFIALVEALDLGLRTIEVLVTHRLEPVKDQFPATIGIQLETPSPEVEPHRDAITVPNSLSFTAILDLLSREELKIDREAENPPNADRGVLFPADPKTQLSERP